MNALKKLTVAMALTASFGAAAITAEEFSQLSPQEALEMAHTWHQTGDASVSILPDVLNATLPSGEEVAIPLEDEYLLSIAPYINRSHGCTYHVPTGCQGEMVEEELHLSITDVNTGEEIMNGMVTTQKDGFIDFWMPRDGEYKFTFHKGNLMAQEVLKTSGNARTCITTMQLVAM
uniref:CueP family metal-binding protein n=1 Tax=Thaumasiovibrio occultus TaxID=1891184 RepID=UPI000B35FF26|nr:CueP family metal-binding protein [Thaumasiovibrio occultus]